MTVHASTLRFGAACLSVLLSCKVALAAPPPAESPATATATESGVRASTQEVKPPPNDADLVETIDPNTSPTPPAPVDAASPVPRPPAAAPAAPPALKTPSQERFELHGWARQSLEIGLSKQPSARGETEQTSVPDDQLVARSQLFLRARYSRARWFEANVSGAVSYSLLERAPSDSDTTFNGFNGESVRGVIEPQLYEAYVGLFSPRLDVRIGQQRLAWGNADFLSPNDVMNARDLRDPFLSEDELRHIPTLMLRADWDLGFATLQGVVEPGYTPDRYDVYGSNWAIVQPDAPRWARGLSNLAGRTLDPSLQEPAQRFLQATRYPKNDFTAPVLGARLFWSVAGLDVNYYYQYGFDGPLVEMDPSFAASLAGVDWSSAGLADLQPWLAAIDAGKPPLSVSFIRRHHVGVDVAKTVGPVALRLDAAYQTKRVFLRRDVTGFVSPTLQCVLSAEYQTGDKDKLALLELAYTHLVDASATRLLIYDQDTLGLVADVRWPLLGILGFELRGLLGIRPRNAIVQPELNLKFQPWTISLGALWLGGEEDSLGHYFRRNLEAYAKVKLLF